MVLKQTLHEAEISLLLVDDDEDDRYIVRKALKKTPHAISLAECENGQEGLDFLRGQSGAASGSRVAIQFIILDLNMPVMDGREFLKELRSDPDLQHIPVVVLTTSREEEILQEARALGANATLSKGDTVEATSTITQMIVDYWMSGTVIDWDLEVARAVA